VNIAMLLEMAAEGMGDRIGVGPRASGLTYADLLDRSRRVARLINEAGVERVGMVAPNSELVPTLLFGGAVAGVPFAPLNYRLADDRLRAICSRLAPAIVVADSGAADRIRGIDGVTVMTEDELSGRVATASPADEGHTDPDQVAVWLFTSGTTGEPKAALLRHRHLVSYVLSTIDYMAAPDDEATLVSVPPYHIAGIATILSSAYSGRRIMYLPQFEPKDWVQIAEQESITHAMVVPTMLNRVLDAAEAADAHLPALHHLSYGGGRMPVPIIERAMRLLPQVGYVNAYGLTETSSTVAVLGPEEHRVAFVSDDPEVRARLGSVGRPLPTLELEIRGPDGDVLPAGETGEIYVRGDQIAGEYHGRSALDADGWFPTNDGGHLDSAGFLFVEGRLDDVIVRGGENMSPGEIEDVLLQHPAVAEAAVVGVPDNEWGEVVAAAVVLEPGMTAGEPELQAWVRDRLRSSRMPTVVEIRDALPYNETGKLLRRVLKEDLAEQRARQV
jgi:acyl-CoA synthetase (AMP-forming)/AMP-acid ligase II